MSGYLPPEAREKIAKDVEVRLNQQREQYEQRSILGYGLAIFGVLLAVIAAFLIKVGGSLLGALLLAIVGAIMLVGGLLILRNRRS